MKTLRAIAILCVFGCGKSPQVEHVAKVEIPVLSGLQASEHEDTENSKTLAKNGLVRLSLEKTDAGAYLSLRGFTSGIRLSAKEAESVASELQKFQAFYQREKDSQADGKESHEIPGYLVEFSKDAKNGFSAAVIEPGKSNVAILNREAIQAILPHLLRASEIIAAAGRAKE